MCRSESIYPTNTTKSLLFTYLSRSRFYSKNMCVCFRRTFVSSAKFAIYNLLKLAIYFRVNADPRRSFFRSVFCLLNRPRVPPAV